jgi:putative ABC transport system permease protein
MLPLSYAWRNLGRIPWKTAQMILGAALVVFLLVAADAVNRGIASCLTAVGDPAKVLILGAGSEESIQRSEIPRVAAGLLAAAVGDIRRVLGRPAVSPEVYYMGMAALPERPDDLRSALFRGVTWEALNVHEHIAIVAGRFPGSGEVMVGRQAARHLGVPAESLAIGRDILFEGLAYRIVGHFQGRGTMMEAELWLDLNDLLTATKRETLSCAVVALRDPADFAAVELFCMQRLDLEMAAIREPDYYASLSRFYRPIRMMVWASAILVAAAAIFGGINTMYAAMAVRRRELATLQAIGFGRRTLLVGLLAESLLISLSGAVLALAVATPWLPRLEVAFSTGVFALVVDSRTLLLGFGVAIALGVVGVILPAWACLRPPIVDSLRAA